MKMRKIATALALLFLAACAGTTALDRVAMLQQGFTVAETAFLGYIRLPDCDTNPQPCSEDDVVAEVGEKDRIAFDAIQNYRMAVLAGRTDTILQELLSAAQAAIAGFQNAIAPLPR